jgi:hypothetical protein
MIWILMERVKIRGVERGGTGKMVIRTRKVPSIE